MSCSATGGRHVVGVTPHPTRLPRRPQAAEAHGREEGLPGLPAPTPRGEGVREEARVRGAVLMVRMGCGRRGCSTNPATPPLLPEKGRG